MATELSTDPGEVMGEQLTALRAYAHRVFSLNQTLADHEEDDKAVRMREFRAVGVSLKLTDKEMVELVYRDTLAVSRGCGCPACQAKR